MNTTSTPRRAITPENTPPQATETHPKTTPATSTAELQERLDRLQGQFEAARAAQRSPLKRLFHALTRARVNMKNTSQAIVNGIKDTAVPDTLAHQSSTGLTKRLIITAQTRPHTRTLLAGAVIATALALILTVARLIGA